MNNTPAKICTRCGKKMKMSNGKWQHRQGLRCGARPKGAVNWGAHYVSKRP